MAKATWEIFPTYVLSIKQWLILKNFTSNWIVLFTIDCKTDLTYFEMEALI